MPEFLEKKLRREYGNNAHAIYGTMNAIGAMHGSKETAKGREMEKKHEDHMAKGSKAAFHKTHITHHDDGSHTIEHEPHMKATKSPAFMEREDGDSYSATTGAEMISKLEEKLGITKHGTSEGEGKGPKAMERADGDEE